MTRIMWHELLLPSIFHSHERDLGSCYLLLMSSLLSWTYEKEMEHTVGEACGLI